jgi:nickel/cobalt exporter
MRLIFLIAVCAVAFLPFAGRATEAGSVPPRQIAETVNAADEIGITDRIVVWIFTQQRNFHRALTERLRDMANNGGHWALAWPLIVASFLYGVFHAAGPGHGKAVVSGYLLTHRQSLYRGMAIAVAGAFMQGLVAIAIVFGFVKLAGLLPRDAQTALVWSERASYVLVIALGVYLLGRALQSLSRQRRRTPGHDHESDHEHDAHCGHVHMPTPQQLTSVTDFRSAAAIVLSVGARPCTGAVIVLVFANVVKLQWAGAVAVLAMSAGTALTVSAFAAFAVTARGLLARLSWLEAGRAAWAGHIVAALGGAAIMALGIMLLSVAMSASHPIMGM